MAPIRHHTIAGAPFERGFAHGRAFADEIALLTEERLRLSTAPYWVGREPSLAEIRDLGQHCLAHHEDFCPDLVAELRGTAAATGLDTVDLLIMNGFTDFIDVVFAGQNDDPGGCTAFAVTPRATADGLGYLGQTWDMHATATPHVLLLEVQPDVGPSLLTFTLAGCVGMIGMNEAGIAVGINNLMARDGRVGVTWPFVVRKMLAQTTVDAALDVLLTTRLAGAHNYLLAGPDGRAFNIEAMATRAHVTPVETLFVHTNHCLAAPLTPLERERTELSRASTTTRLEQAAAYLDRHQGQLTAAHLLDLTRLTEGDGFSVCSHARPGYDIESSGACLMSPATGDFWAVWGPPCQNDYQRFTVSRATAQRA